jgi:protein TonB
MRPLHWSLAISWTLHGGLILLVWLQLVGDRSPSVTVLQLIGPADSGPPAPSAPAPVPSPEMRRPTPRREAPTAAVPIAREEPAPGAAPASEPGATESRSSAPPADGDVAAVDGLQSSGVAGSGEASTAMSSAPRIASQPPPRYPEAARRAGAQGTTMLKVRVSADGTVGEIVIERSSGHPELDAAAAEAVGRWRFAPARRRGEPVDVWILLPIRFTLS